mgnify:CR=1 FL=1
MDYKLIIIIVLLLVAVVGYIRLYRHYRRNIKKVTFLFDAIDNGDFSFNFPTEKGFKEDKILHKSLNRIKLFLQHTREEQMDREKYYEQILNAVDTGILVVDSHDNILQHNQAALRLLDTDVLTHMNQVKGKLKDEHLAKHETQAMLKDKHVRIIALSDVSHELSNQEVDSWIKLIRVLTHEIMNTITPVTSLSETLLTRVTEDKDLKQGLETIHKTGTELLAFVNNYRRFTHVPQPQPALFYVEPFLERMAMLCNHEVEISVSPKDLLAYADESLLSHVVTNLLKNAVEAFKEKPNLETAEQYLAAGNYYWNAGIFVWNIDTISKAIRSFQPNLASIMDEMAPSFYTEQEKEVVGKLFPTCEKISIDYAVMEKSKDIFTLPAEFGWSDLGSWGSLRTLLPQDEDGNAKVGKDIRLYECKNCVVHAADESKVVVQGLDGCIVAEKNGRLLVCSLKEEQRIKEFGK